MKLEFWDTLHIIVQSIIRTKYLKPMKQSKSQTRFVKNPKKSRNRSGYGAGDWCFFQL